jgi:hypothetical protein
MKKVLILLLLQFVCLFYSVHLEEHLVWLVVVGKRKLSVQVCLEHRNSIDSLQQSSINSLLVSLAGVRNNSSLGSVSSEEILLVRRLGACKVCIGERGNINGRNVDGGAGSDNVSRTYTTKRNSVHLVRSRNEDESTLENLKGDNTLSTETSSEKDEDSSRCDGSTNLRCVVSSSLTRLKCNLDIISRVVLSSADRCSSLLGSSCSNYFL